MTDLETKLGAVARSPIVLIACDFDGTLAEIVPDPSSARIAASALQSLKDLAELPETFVAVISGRSLDDLRARAAWGSDIRLVGSHGVEFDRGRGNRLSSEALATLQQITAELCQIASTAPGFILEEKPTSIALHYRLVDPAAAEAALAAVLSGPACATGVFVRRGKKVVELSVVSGDKGRALADIRYRVGATATVFFGDDATDEDAFKVLTAHDLGVKVGDGPSLAPCNVTGTADVGAALERLVALRRTWLTSSTATPIDDLAVLSDQRTVALLTPSARVVWLCVPRIDSAALFCELLGGPVAGYFDIQPMESGDTVRREYLEGSLVLQTQWPALTVTDYLDCSNGRPYQRAGRTDLIRVLEGRGRVIIRFAPRLDFGRTMTRLKIHAAGIEVEGIPDPIVLYAPGVAWHLVDQGPHQTAIAEVELNAQPLIMELRYGSASFKSAPVPEPERRRLTEHHWRAWVSRLTLPSVRPDLVHCSALALRALCYRPTGAIAAAATTSLPEYIGGVRNWDYRFCWPRDAAMAAATLVRLGSHGPALGFLDWLMGVLDHCESPERLRPIYTVSGGHLGPEAEIAELAGYQHSRPVRTSNAAAQQVQLDVFGPITELLALLVETNATVTPEHWRLTEAMVAAVERRWQEPDHGIWEIRAEPRHHVHSKIMCWQTVDRAQRIAEQLHGRRRPEWDELRDRIAHDVLNHGWNPRVNSFTTSYGCEDLDAAVLHVGLSGLLPPDDPRFVRTVEAIETQLRHGPIVYRYRFDDGLPGRDGGFHLCTGWMIQALQLLGRDKDAWALFDSLASLVGSLGFLSEQYDPRRRFNVGNYPQALSHVAIIDCAVQLAARPQPSS